MVYYSIPSGYLTVRHGKWSIDRGFMMMIYDDHRDYMVFTVNGNMSNMVIYVYIYIW